MKEIKNIMKAKAWILTLLIGMIGLVGIGQTTSDLIQNSEAESIVKESLTVETVSVVESPILVNVFTYELNGSTMEVRQFIDNDCEYLKFGEAVPGVKTKDHISDIGDVGWKNLTGTINSTIISKSYFRKPRGALSF